MDRKARYEPNTLSDTTRALTKTAQNCLSGGRWPCGSTQSGANWLEWSNPAKLINYNETGKYNIKDIHPCYRQNSKRLYREISWLAVLTNSQRW